MDGEDPNVVLDGAFECPDCGNGYASEEHRDNHRFWKIISIFGKVGEGGVGRNVVSVIVRKKIAYWKVYWISFVCMAIVS